MIPKDELGPEYIIPSVFNRDVTAVVAAAVADAAEADGVARRFRAGSGAAGLTTAPRSPSPPGYS